MINKKINDFLNLLDNQTKQNGKQLYLDGHVNKIFEIKPQVFRAIITQHGIESKITVSFKDETQVNCECQAFRTKGTCSHVVAVMYYLLNHPINQASQFVHESIDNMVYNCSERQAKEYLLGTLNKSSDKHEFIEFLFFRLRDLNLKPEDYQYLFDYLYTLSDSQDRLKVIHRLYDSLFERFRLKLTQHLYKEALLILKEMIINEESFNRNVETNLAYFEEHLSKNVIHIKSCIKYLTIYADDFNETENEAYYQVVLELTKNPKIYVACYSEIKNLIFDHFTHDHLDICYSMKNLYLLLANCSDVCRQSTVELIFKLISPQDADYPYYKAIYSALLFNRAYNPGNLNFDLLEEIKKLNEDSYANDMNHLVRYMNEKHAQKQLLDVLVNDENFNELAQSAKHYPSLRHLYIYKKQLKAAIGEYYNTLVFDALVNFVNNFPTNNDTIIAYIYIDEGEEYFMLLASLIIHTIDQNKLSLLIDEYLKKKYSMIPSSLPINRRLENFATSLKQKD